MKKEIKLVIADIDSTLVNDERILLPKTKQVIESLHDKGILFGIASGRPLDEISQYAARWGFDYQFDVLIGMNGSELWDEKKQKQFDYFKLKKDWIKEIINAMSLYEYNPMMYVDGKIYCREINEIMLRSARYSYKEAVVVPIESFYAKENAKIMFRMKEDDVLEAEAYFNANPNPYYAAFKTQPTLLEFADRRIKKSYALEKFCEMNAISLEHVAAFGDTTNDNDMIEISGVGVCMCNGSEDTKAIADYITEFDHNHEGFAHFLIKYLAL